MATKKTININGNVISCDEETLAFIISQLSNATPTANFPTKTARKPVARTTVKPAAKPAAKTAAKPAAKTTPKPAAKAPAKPKLSHKKPHSFTPDPKNPMWYDEFCSEQTTVDVGGEKATTVKVYVNDGYGPVWHDNLRAAGFRWSKKGFWWAPKDDMAREAIAMRNIEIDEGIAGLTTEERRAWYKAHPNKRTA